MKGSYKLFGLQIILVGLFLIAYPTAAKTTISIFGSRGGITAVEFPEYQVVCFRTERRDNIADAISCVERK